MSRHDINSPWRRSTAISDAVHDADGALVAIVYGRTLDQSRRRLLLIEQAPALLEAVEALLASWKEPRGSICTRPQCGAYAYGTNPDNAISKLREAFEAAQGVP
jgi:hypothetical protein